MTSSFTDGVKVGRHESVHWIYSSRTGTYRRSSPHPKRTHDHLQQQAQAQPPGPAPSPATTVITPVKPVNATGGGNAPTTAAARLNLTGNAKAPAGTAALLDLASGAAAANEEIKAALEHDPSLMDVLDDGRFFRGKQLSPQQECFPMTAEELEYAIEVRVVVLWADGHHPSVTIHRRTSYTQTISTTPQETDCVLVHLAPSDNTPDNPYRLNRQINVTHSVILQGDTLDQPFIDCFDAVRCFRVFVSWSLACLPFVQVSRPIDGLLIIVAQSQHHHPQPKQPGAYLTMRYVGINQGTGEYRDAIPFLEGVPTTPTGMVSKGKPRRLPAAAPNHIDSAVRLLVPCLVQYT